MARRIDRSRLRSETAKKIYDDLYGAQQVQPVVDDESDKIRLLEEKRRQFAIWAMGRELGRKNDNFSEEQVREFERMKQAGYKAPEANDTTSRNGTANIPAYVPEVIPVSEEAEKKNPDTDSGTARNPGSAKPAATTDSQGDFLENLKKQYSNEGKGQDPSSANPAVDLDTDASSAQQPEDLSDKTVEGSTTGNNSVNNSPSQAPKQTPGFVRSSKGPLTSKVPQISLEEYLTYMEDSGVVGEEKNLLRFGFRLGQLKPTFIDGKAGSGKTYIIKAGLSMLPKDYVLTVDCASNTSLFIDEKEVEKYPIIWFKEFQKVAYKSGGNNELLEMIKSWAEGEDAKRRVNDHGKLKFQTITEKCVISCIATENDKKGRFDRDKETLRRFDILHTDESQEHVKKVMEYKAKLRVTNSQPKKLSQLKADQVKRHFKELVDISIDKDNELLVSNPFAEAIKEYIPETPRAISYMDMYYDYVEGCTKFHYKNRLGENNLIISDLHDLYVIYRIYHDDFCDMLQKLDDLSEEEFQKRAQKSKDTIDWRAIFESGYETVKACFSEEVAEEWVARQLVGNKITVWDPILKKDVVIVDYNNPTPSSQTPKQYGHQALPSDQAQQYAPTPDTTPVTEEKDPQTYTPQIEQEDPSATDVKEEEVDIQPVDEISLDDA
ncbi:hypothetical protein KY326_01565 [Candidatus Woesearchaeota archaeon]|nr:hypothetical protein [Candidatus Woesearchaeota archaeon]